jgi:hypothetical protein
VVGRWALGKAALVLSANSSCRLTGPDLFVCPESTTSTLSDMASLENRQQTFPAIPPSFSAGGHEMRDYYDNSSAPQPSPNQNPYLTPYLGLRARLSQVWINRWTVLLLLVLVRVLFAIANAGDLLSDARAEALSVCSDVEKVGSTLASIPYYASQGFNQMTASGIEKAVGGLHTMVDLLLTGLEEIIVFYIGMLTNTYLCLITFAVSGSLHAVVDVVADAENGLNQTLSGISNDISGIATDLQKGIQGLVAGINTVFGKNNPPNVDFSGPINALKNVTLPAGLTTDLQKLNNSIPNFDQVKNLTDSAIRLPFEEVKSLINKAWTNYTFNHSILPVPQKETLGFCSDNPKFNNFFDHLASIMINVKRAFLGILLTLAILACVPMAFMEIRRFHKLQNRSRRVDGWATDRMDAAYLYSRPYTSDFGYWLAGRSRNVKNQVLVRWCIAYFTSIPALFLLSIAVAGLFACLCQIIVVKSIEKVVPELTAEMANFTGEIVTKLNNASASWATKTNNVIMTEGDRLNQDLFGWVNISTTAVNDTLNKFVDETLGVLNTTFGGTPLYDPIKEVFNCLIGLKVQGIEAGLTWVHDNAHINFPLLSNDTLTGGAILGKASPETKAFFDDPTDVTQAGVSSVLTKVTDKIEAGIKQEAIVAGMVLLAWLIVFLSGFITAYIRSRGRDKLRGEAGNEYIAPAFPSNNNNQQLTNDKYQEPLGPAPAYSTTNHDVNADAPYALNPHPIPRGPVDNYEEIDLKQGSSNNNQSLWPPQNQNQYVNEKNGYI